MSRRRSATSKPPRYVIPSDDDDDDFCTPILKKARISHSSQESDAEKPSYKTQKSKSKRKTVNDRVFNRDIEKAIKLSSSPSAAPRVVNSSAPSDLPSLPEPEKENTDGNVSLGVSTPSELKSSPLHKSQASDVSSYHDIVSDFKVEYMSESESDYTSSDSDDDFSGDEDQPPLPKKKTQRRTVTSSKAGTPIGQTSDILKDSTGPCGGKTTLSRTPGTTSRTPSTTPNIPAILSARTPSATPPPNHQVTIGLSKNRRYKPLHANVKR